MEVEVGGGIRSESAIKDVLKLGAKRAIIGTMAVKDFAFTKSMGAKYGNKLAVGVDVKDGMVATHGWTEVSEISGFTFCQKLRDAGISTVIYTDISKDGLLAGTNLAAYEQLMTIQGLNVIASGRNFYRGRPQNPASPERLWRHRRQSAVRR